MQTTKHAKDTKGGQPGSVGVLGLLRAEEAGTAFSTTNHANGANGERPKILCLHVLRTAGTWFPWSRLAAPNQGGSGFIVAGPAGAGAVISMAGLAEASYKKSESALKE